MSSSSPKPKLSTGIGSFKRRFKLSSPPLPPVVNPSPIAESPIREATEEAPKPKLSTGIGSLKRRFKLSSPPLPPVVTPSPIVESPIREATEEAPKPKLSARIGSSLMRRTSSVFTISRRASSAFERDTDQLPISGSTRTRADSTLISPPLPPVVTPRPIAESSIRETAAEAQGAAGHGPSPLSKSITTSEVVLPTLSPPFEETQSPTRYIPFPVIDSTAGNHDPGAFTDVSDDLLQPDIAQDPQIVAPVEPPVESATLNAPDLSEPAITTEELVVEPTSYYAEPMAESIKDFEPVNHVDNTAELSEAVHGIQNATIEEVVPENTNNVVLPEPDLGHREETQAQALHHDDAVPVATKRERQEEPQHESEPILTPVPVPNYDMPSYPLNLGSERKVWGGEHDHGTYPSSAVPVVNSSSEDDKPERVERSRVPFTDPIAPRITVSQPVLNMPQPEFDDNHHADTGNLIKTDESLPLLSRPGTPSTNDLPQVDIAHDPQAVAVAPVEPPVEPASLNAPVSAEPEAIITEALMAESISDFEHVDHADITDSEFGEADSILPDPAAEAQEAVGSSPLAQSITSSVVVLPSTLSSPVEEEQSPTGYIPPSVIDFTVGNPGTFTNVTDDLPQAQPDIAQDPQAIAPVEPPVELATLNAPEPEEPAIITEELDVELTSYYAEPMSESIEDFEPVDHVDNTAELSEAVHGNANDISPESHHEQNGEAAEYYHGDVIPTTEEVVPENTNNVVLPEPDLVRLREDTHAEALRHDEAVPVATERGEPQHESEPILIPVPVPNYDMPSYPLNLGSERELWGGELDHGTYPSSSIPVVDSSSEDNKRAERSPAPSIRVPFTDPIAPRTTVSQPVLNMPQPEFDDNYQLEPAETHSHGPVVMSLPTFIDHRADTGNLTETDESLPLLSRPGTPSANDLPQADIAQDAQAVAVAPIEPPVGPASLNAPDSAEPEAIVTEALMTEGINDFEPVDHSDITEFGEADPLLRDPSAEAQEAVGRSPLAQSITSSVVVPPTLPPPVEEAHGPMEHIPSPVIDSTARNPGAFTTVTDDHPPPDHPPPDNHPPPDHPPPDNPDAPSNLLYFIPAVAVGAVCVCLAVYPAPIIAVAKGGLSIIGILGRRSRGGR